MPGPRSTRSGERPAACISASFFATSAPKPWKWGRRGAIICSCCIKPNDVDLVQGHLWLGVKGYRHTRRHFLILWIAREGTLVRSRGTDRKIAAARQFDTMTGRRLSAEGRPVHLVRTASPVEMV